MVTMLGASPGIVPALMARCGRPQEISSPLGDREARRRIGYLPELFRVIYGLEPPILIPAAQGQPLAEANPFFAATPPPVGFLVWVVTWTVIVLSLAALSLRRREL
ncbi:MAG: hypothetical protein K2X91_02600 [Thermoleophilia bacterium]|nr:hypothetical protein [Thermoleophilia bacterium]